MLQLKLNIVLMMFQLQQQYFTYETTKYFLLIS